jgi:gluconate kinase
LQSQFDTLERPTPAEALIVDAGLPPDEIVPAIRRDLHL